MDPQQQWQKIKEVVGNALERDAASRADYLDRACKNDPGLRAEVDSLLSAHARADALSEHPLATGLLDAIPASRTIGPYLLIREIAVGGMGQVWLAEQMEPVRRRVALKLIRPGVYSATLLQRFEAERQSLAIMDHPAIAKVFDAGATPTGQPYFAMEYVDGLPITEYCDQKKLSIRERLQLFLQVCEGVQHAHQKAIIHRDLKPSNILVAEVDGKPTPRIIDFGLAKAVTPAVPGETLFTQAGAFLGTPGYMSPEQANPSTNDIDTRTDVYSLGVILYELLTGYLPQEAATWKNQPIDEALRRLRETDPERPSTKVSANRETSTARAAARATEPGPLVSTLRGDLDWITLKAIEKDRARRYGTPSELAADIGRYLENRPVIARPASAGYRLRKYVRRNRVAVAITAATVGVLVAFAVMQTIQLRRITRERDRADRVTEFMTNMFKVSDPSEARGNSITAREILDKASRDLQTSRSMDPVVQADLLDAMAGTYTNLGLYSRAQELAQQALDSRVRLLGTEDRKTLESMNRLAWAQDRAGRFADAEKLERQTLAIEQRKLSPDDLLTLHTMNTLGVIMQGQGRYDEQERLERKVVDSATRTLGPGAQLTMQGTNNLGASLLYQGHYAEAENIYRQLLETENKVLGPDHPETLLAVNNLAWAVLGQDRFPEAEQIYRQALDKSRRVLGPGHRNTALLMSNLAGLLVRENKLAEGESLQREAVTLDLQALGPEHSDTLMAKSNLAGTLFEEGHFQQAEQLERELLAAQIRTLGLDHDRTLLYETDLAATLVNEGHNDAEAEKLARHAFEHQLRNLGPSHPNTLNSMQQLGMALAHTHRYPEAVKLVRDVIDQQAKTPNQEDQSSVWYSFACVALAAGDRDEALQYLRESVHRGYKDVDGLISDHDLAALHNHPDFQKIVDELKAPATKAATP